MLFVHTGSSKSKHPSSAQNPRYENMVEPTEDTDAACPALRSHAVHVLLRLSTILWLLLCVISSPTAVFLLLRTVLILTPLCCALVSVLGSLLTWSQWEMLSFLYIAVAFLQISVVEVNVKVENDWMKSQCCLFWLYHPPGFMGMFPFGVLALRL